MRGIDMEGVLTNYPPPQAPQPRRNMTPILWVIIGALAVVTAVLITLLATRKTAGSGGGGPTTSPTTGSDFGAGLLSHTAVEQFITSHLSAGNVRCNHGHDMPLTAVGATYTCTADGGKTFTITIKDTNTGAYVVS